MHVVIDDLTVDVAVQGFPGRSGHHGGLGWCSTVVVRGQGHVGVIDPGSFGVRRLLRTRLRDLGIATEDVTDVLVTHAHFDHSVNWPMFANANVIIGEEEIAWGVAEPAGDLVPEFSIAELARYRGMRPAADRAEVFPGVTAHLTSGHTPGHLTYVLHGREWDVIFTGDAAKNRAELLTRQVDMTYDAERSARSIEDIWSWWRSHEHNVLIPGHDVAMSQEDGRCRYLDERVASVNAWYGDDLADITKIDLVPRMVGT